ncbi:MAG: hypothetical protein AAF927_08285 [Bacteroidota bacterium]
MKRHILTVLCFFTLLGFSQQIQAQGGTAVGLRMGSPTAVSIKHYFKEATAIEAYVGTRGFSSYRRNNVSVAMQIHKPLDYLQDYGQLAYYYGAGVSAYFWRYGDLTDGLGFDRTSFGLQAYGGFDFLMDEYPINISIDWTPSIFLGNGYYRGLGVGYGTLSVRYILGQ